jgi:hypothetical protein
VNSPRFLIAEPRFHLASSTLEFAPAGRFELGIGRDPERNAEEPARQGIGSADRATAFGQYQERRLRSVFGVMNVAQDIATDAQDHRPVALDNCREGGRGVGVTAPRKESVQERTVRQIPERACVQDRLQLSQRGDTSFVRHPFRTPEQAGRYSSSTDRGGNTANYFENLIEK